MRGALGTRRNILANFVGRALVNLVGLLLLPLYLRLLGIEAYGLVGVYSSLLAMIGVLDLGLSTLLNREMARLSIQHGAEQRSHDLVHTLEIVYWGVTIVVACGCIALAPTIAGHWLHPIHLSQATVTQAVVLMGLVLVFQWPDSFYAGGLMGLQRQVLLNGLRAGVAIFQGVGALLVLMFVSRSVLAFFVWQALVCAVQTLLLRQFLWSALPPAQRRPCFDRRFWEDHWRFAGGLTGAALMSTVILQSDKILLSRLLTLQMFGYYALATQVANALSYFVNPIFAAAFPRLSQLVAGHDPAPLKAFYHTSCQLLAAILLPAWAVLVLFAPQLLTLYFHNAATVAPVSLFLIGIVTGVAVNALVMLPYGLQLAYGWSSLNFYKTGVAALGSIPLLFWLVGSFGAVGASAIRALVNVGYVLVEIPIMHRRLLKTEMWRWYLEDVGLPLALSVGIGAAGRTLFPKHTSPILALCWISAVFLCAVSACVGTLPNLRCRLIALKRHKNSQRI